MCGRRGHHDALFAAAGRRCPVPALPYASCLRTRGCMPPDRLAAPFPQVTGNVIQRLVKYILPVLVEVIGCGNKASGPHVGCRRQTDDWHNRLLPIPRSVFFFCPLLSAGLSVGSRDLRFQNRVL